MADRYPELRAQTLDALELQDLSVVFQPVLELETRDIFAYETLMRSPGTAGFTPPQLLRTAVERGVVGPLGRLIRSLAVADCPDFPLLINIHPQEFDAGWLVQPDDPIFSHEYPIYLEITESVPMSHQHYCHGILGEIRAKGIRVAVDDLGAGYSNLKYIADLSPDIVKLDRELVADLTTESRVFKLVESVTRLCVDLGARVVAEGIERQEELDAVRAAGVHYGQGYFIARPSTPPPAPINGTGREDGKLRIAAPLIVE